MSKEFKLTTVYVATNQPEAEIIKGRLEFEGIPAILRYESSGSLFVVMADGLAQIEIQVPSKLAKKAKEVLNSKYSIQSDQ